jgi:FkbM family methyltransferase
MNATTRKLLRTVQTNFPNLLDLKFAVMRKYRMWRRVPFEPDFEALALFPASKDALFLDIGANRGQSTDAILIKTESGHIQQFEPNRLLCEKLIGLYGKNPRVTTNAFGLADVASEQTLYVPFYKKWMFDGLASFDATHARGWLKDRVFFYSEEHVTLQETKCSVRRLDEFGLNPFFMKLDIQGYELQALKGGKETIKLYEPILLVELPEEEIVNYLKGFGYVMYAFRKGKFVPGVAGVHNTFFMTHSKSALVKSHMARGIADIG